jgi:polysaccharide pyruvyl transferase WcaK-like protein
MVRDQPPTLREPILVVGGYGYRNVGDEAILAGLLRELGEARLTVVSRSPAETTALHGVRAVGVGQALGELRRHRSVLIGGGGLFGRDMGRLGQLIGPFGLMAALAGKTVAIEAVGVDRDLPSTSVLALRLLAGRIADFRVRDRTSQEALAGWGIAARLTDDLSTSMEPASRREGRALLRAAGLDPARPIVGLCLTEVGPTVGWELQRAIATLVDEMPDVQFCAIPMSQHPYVARHNDLLLAQRLREQIPRLALLEGLHHPTLVLAAFGTLSAAVCMRYHSLLFAHRAGIPIVAIPYAEKCRSWLADHQLAATPADGPALVVSLRAAMGQRLELEQPA